MADPAGPTLVTGALGCVGAWTVKALLEAGANIDARDSEGWSTGCGLLSPTRSSQA